MINALYFVSILIYYKKTLYELYEIFLGSKLMMRPSKLNRFYTRGRKIFFEVVNFYFEGNCSTPLGPKENSIKPWYQKSKPYLYKSPALVDQTDR